MNIYDKLIEHVSQGGKFNVNLKTKTLKIGKKYYVKDGEVMCNDDIMEINNDAWEYMYELYDNFKHSIPSSHYRDNSYFRALKYEDLSTNDMILGDDRNVAQAKLEGFILFATLNGSLKWKWADKWFWQSELDKEFVMLKEWF